MAADVVSESESGLSILVEELIYAEQKAVELAESGAGLASINEQFALVSRLHQQIHALQPQVAQQS